MIELHDKDFYRLVEFIKENYGINLISKRHLIEGRLGSFIQEKGYSDYEAYFNHIFSGNSKEEILILLNRLTTNHTFFLREEEHFNFFAETVLPWLHSTVKDNDLRIWSAGCSSGEEPYMLAMLLQEYLGGEACFWDKKILATDICTQVLEKACTGVYTGEDVARLDMGLRSRYFRKAGKELYQVTDALKKEVIFRVFNLMEDFPFRRKFHVIFCRNVMIYFDQSTRDRLIQKFYDMTEDGGYLFIGMSESIRRDNSRYSYIMPSVYRKGT